ncbi:Glutamate receptor 2.8 [Dichanthelium oligosanthes]|uniref:Glutamate receptor 2.8 n=1 Tax=Dichanthelium oligosanthes TaxID=888268 RepID=A0A1E5USJ3_9POAL|nr:Glutamate receptor 2.8 [Dichanthelium oligosanthes]
MLTVQQLQPTVTYMKELIRRGDYIGYQEGSFVPSELKKMNFDESKLRSYGTPDQYAEALSKGSANGGVAAIFDEIPYLKLFLSQYCDGYAMIGPIYKDAGFDFVFPKGSPMAPGVSRAIVSLTEGDELALIERKWFGDPGGCDSQGSGVGSSSLSFWSFSGLFLVTGVASGLMLVVYLATFVYRERNELRAAEPGAGSMSPRRLRAWLQHYDRKDTRSPSFKRWNDGSVTNVVDAKQGNGAGKEEAFREMLLR